MKIPPNVIERTGPHDADTLWFLRAFQAPESAKVIEVGAHDECSANVLAECGFNVTGVDLREYDPKLPPCNYRYLRADWCNMPERFWMDHYGTFDVFYSLSALEHFGLGTYREGGMHEYCDTFAMRYAWDCLRDGGYAYITVPYGKEFVTSPGNWRVYNRSSLFLRLVGEFSAVAKDFFASEYCAVNGRVYHGYDVVPVHDADAYVGEHPHMTVGLVLQKVASRRLAPDGR